MVLLLWLALSIAGLASAVSSSSSSSSSSSMSILFIHIGDKFLAFQKITIMQARLFNPQNMVYLVVNKAFLGKDENKEFLETYKVTFVSIDSLTQTDHHKKFNNQWLMKGNRKIYEFWHFTTERFFIAEEFMRQHNVERVLHIESDNMIYFSLDDFASVFRLLKPIATIFDTYDRAVPGLVYIRDTEAAGTLAKYIEATKKEKFNDNDMSLLGKFLHYQGGRHIDHLPIMPLSYGKKYKLSNSDNKTQLDMQGFYEHYEKFNNSIFDAASIGQYLGGTNDEHKVKGTNSTIGFVNPSSVLDPRRFGSLEWRKDPQGRFLLVATLPSSSLSGNGGRGRQEEMRVNNVHVHCKRTEQFYSLRAAVDCEKVLGSDYYSTEQKSIFRALHSCRVDVRR